MRKLSRPWHGPYHITNTREPNVDVTKVYFPKDGGIQVHQSRVKHCPPNFPADFYWYGGKQRDPGRPPKWVEQVPEGGTSNQLAKNSVQDASDTNDPEEECSSTQHIPTSVEPKVDMRNQQHYQLCQNPRSNITVSLRTSLF